MMRGVSTEDGLTWCFQARIRVCLGQPRGTTHCSFEDAEQFHQTQAVRLTLPTTRHGPRHAVTAIDLLAVRARLVEVCPQSSKLLLSHRFIFRAVSPLRVKPNLIECESVVEKTDTQQNW